TNLAGARRALVRTWPNARHEPRASARRLHALVGPPGLWNVTFMLWVSLCPENGMLCASGGIAGADYLALSVDGSGNGKHPAQRPQVGHRALFPQVGMALTSGGVAKADHLALIVEGSGLRALE